MLDNLRETSRPAMLSAIITCYRDAPAIAVMHERLTRVLVQLGVDYEIIFVNDGSPDDASVVLESLVACDEHVLVIEHSRNFGSQHSFVSGMQLSVGDAVILLDGDLQDPPELISSFFERWREGYEVVYGVRSQRDGSQTLAALARLFYQVFRRASDVPMPLHAGDFGLMDRRVVDVLLDLPESDQFIRGLRAWVGFKQTGVAYRRPERVFGRSTHSFWKNLWWAKKAILSFSFAPIELLGYVAAVLSVLSACAVAAQLVLAFLRPEFSLGVPMIIATVACFGSLNLLAVALIGEYIMKVFDETKKRPRFIRRMIRYGSETLEGQEQQAAFSRCRSERAAMRWAERERALGGYDG